MIKRLVMIILVIALILMITTAGIKKGEININTSITTTINLPPLINVNTITEFVQVGTENRITGSRNEVVQTTNVIVGSRSEIIGREVRPGSFPTFLEFRGSRLETVGTSSSVIGSRLEFINSQDAIVGSSTITGALQHIRTDILAQREEGDVKIITQREIFQRTDRNVINFVRINNFVNVNQLAIQNNLVRVDMFVEVVDPLVIDLDTNNLPDVPGNTNLPKKNFDKKRAKIFDLNADGVKDFVEWIGPNDGLILFFENNKIKEDVNGFNLMSNAFGYKNGFEKMQENFDFNKDNKITDEELDNIYIWQDKNQDAKVQSDELIIPSQIGIVEIGTVYGANTLEGYAKTKDGKIIKVWQWWPSIEWGIGKKI